MAKFTSTLILVGVIITVQAIPPSYDERLAAAQKNQLEQLLRNKLATNAEFKPVTFDGVRNLKPVDGGHVYGEAEYSFHSASNIDGKTTEDKAGHKVINNDGKVKEFDFTPKTQLSPLIHPINPQSQTGNDYGVSGNPYQYPPSSASQSAEYVGIGGKKVGNNNVKIGQPTNLPAIPHSFTNIPNQGAKGSHNSYNQQYSYSHAHSYVNGKPVEGGLVNHGGNFQLDAQKAINSPISYTDVRDLKPPQGGQVFGEAQFQFHTSSNIDGKVSEDQGGHKIINNNGQVQEFDFTPKTQLSPLIHPINPQSQTGNDYGVSGNPYQYAPSSASQSAEYVGIGGKKVGNNNFQIGQQTNLPAIPHSFASVPNQGAKGSHNSYNQQYSYSHAHSYVNGKPVEGGLVNHGGNFQLDAQKAINSPISYTDVRDLKPPQGGQVFGEAQFQFHTSSNIDGKVSEDQGGHKIINNNGQVQEFDFKPSPQMLPVVNYFN